MSQYVVAPQARTDIKEICRYIAKDSRRAAGKIRDLFYEKFVQGMNLHQFPAYIEQFPLLVSFNGSQFDVPFLQAHFPHARLDQAHIDLRFVLASLGYRGGLKAVERDLGLRRDPTIQGVDGFEAVQLWYRYCRGDFVEARSIVDLALRLHLAPPGGHWATTSCRSRSRSTASDWAI